MSTFTLEALSSFPSDRLRSLFGLEHAALGELLATALPVLVERRFSQQQAKKNRQRSPGGGRRRKLAPYQEILLTLVYLRHNVSHAVAGFLFEVSADISENTFHEVVQLLRDLCPAHRFDAEKKWTKKEPSWHPDTLDLILVDSFETPVSRPSREAAQRKVYSGKKKRHTLKTQIITDARGEVLSLEAGYPGPMSDKKLYDGSEAAKQYPRAARRADLGYVGVPEMLLPHKKPKGAPLTQEQHDENRYTAKQRVYVEHGVRRVKAWRILRDEFRLAQPLFPLIAAVTIGLVHLSRIVPGR